MKNHFTSFAPHHICTTFKTHSSLFYLMPRKKELGNSYFYVVKIIYGQNSTPLVFITEKTVTFRLSRFLIPNQIHVHYFTIPIKKMQSDLKFDDGINEWINFSKTRT